MIIGRDKDLTYYGYFRHRLSSISIPVPFNKVHIGLHFNKWSYCYSALGALLVLSPGQP